MCQGMQMHVDQRIEALLRKDTFKSSGTSKLLIGDELLLLHPSFRLFLLTEPGEASDTGLPFHIHDTLHIEWIQLLMHPPFRSFLLT